MSQKPHLSHSRTCVDSTHFIEETHGSSSVRGEALHRGGRVMKLLSVLALTLLVLVLVTSCDKEVTATIGTAERPKQSINDSTDDATRPPTPRSDLSSPLESSLNFSSPILSPAPSKSIEIQFDGQEAFEHLVYQMELGPRITGTEESRQAGDYFISYLEQLGWRTEEQIFVYQDTSVRNIIGRIGEGPIVIVGAHYDTRRRADRDPENPTDPVPGANDGASGVAVLLELARVIDPKELDHELWLVFFDAEDNGGLDGWEWIVGSTYMAEHLTVELKYVIIVDMIGDTDQNIHWERNSDPQLNLKIWNLAKELGYERYFLSSVKHSIIDDHTPFARQGIPAIDIIDFDYPYWHTTADTLDKTDPESLERVGRVLEAFIEEQL